MAKNLVGSNFGSTSTDLAQTDCVPTDRQHMVSQLLRDKLTWIGNFKVYATQSLIGYK